VIERHRRLPARVRPDPGQIPFRSHAWGLAAGIALPVAVALGAMVLMRARPAEAAPAGHRATPAPQIQLDKSKVDLVNHRLELRMSHPAAQLTIRVLADTGEVLADDRHDFTGQPAGAPLTVTWNPSSAAPAARIEINATDIAGGFAGVALFSWSLTIPHEEVVFKTDSADIQAAEKPKLEASLQKITEALAKHKDDFGRPTLFVAGHTDTVGAPAHNLTLSQARARSIAGWFRAHGLRIPIAFEGFGESSLAVPTPDNTDEVRNRRADYILSVEDPSLKSTGFRPSWKRLR